MDRRNYVTDKRNVKLDELFKDGYIPFMEGRPEREAIINDDDVANLVIALNTDGDLSEFLRHT